MDVFSHVSCHFGPAFTMKSLFILSKLPCTRMIPAVRCTCKALLLFGGSDSGGEVLKIVGLTDPDTLNMLQTYNQKGNIQSAHSAFPQSSTDEFADIQPICSWIPEEKPNSNRKQAPAGRNCWTVEPMTFWEYSLHQHGSKFWWEKNCWEFSTSNVLCSKDGL